MKLLSFDKNMVVQKHYDGILHVSFSHEITKSSAEVQYLGPKIQPDVWKQILSFFQWTYDTTKSESQVRLFLNTKEPRWAAWAFPQEARTGMSARELDTPAAKAQRQQFSDQDGWEYFGTVHHHCGASAFQSGVDRMNEEKIDGLHITIGQMASARYDMHARFYLGTFCFEPDMGKFWDIPDQIKSLLPFDVWDRIARWTMCEKVPPNLGYPDQWKENLIEVKQTFPAHQTGTPGYAPGAGGFYYSSRYGSTMERAKKAMGELALNALDSPENQESQKALSEWIREINFQTDNEIAELLRIMKKYDVDASDLWRAIPHNNLLEPCIAAYSDTQVPGTKEVKQLGEDDQDGPWLHQHMME
jgi:hypothetical protein